MSRIASLGMYDHPAQAAANDRLWGEIARILRLHGVPGVPNTLDRSRPVQEIWRDPGLLFGQICGYPLIRQPELALRVLALPIYDAPGCVDDTHCSFLIARKGDTGDDLAAYRGRRAAINESGSNSGMNLFRAAVARIADGAPFFGSVRETGSHRESVRAIVLGDADVTAIDAVTFAALARFEPELTIALQTLGRTPASPTLPFVTGRATDGETTAALQIALAQALADPGLAPTRAALFLTGVTRVGIDRFASLRHFESDAVLAGYPDLR